MPRSVEIDPQAGFCGGVIRAISRAEAFLEASPRLFSLGAIVHNEAELERLAGKGLTSVDSLQDVPEGAPVLIRAHGEPPETYAAAHHGSEVPEGIVGSSAAMEPTEVRSENEALICL